MEDTSIRREVTMELFQPPKYVFRLQTYTNMGIATCKNVASWVPVHMTPGLWVLIRLCQQLCLSSRCDRLTSYRYRNFIFSGYTHASWRVSCLVQMLSCVSRNPPNRVAAGAHKLWSSKKVVAVVFARKRSPVSEGLSTVLKDELKIEKERYRTPDAVLEGPPSGYELEDRPNSNVLLLTRTFGAEEIFVEVDLDSQAETADLSEIEDEVEEDEDSFVPPVQFIVNVAKGDKALAFNCQTAGEDIRIKQVSLNDTMVADEEAEGSFIPYTGPMFDELDDTLQQAFIDYLEERGINSEFAYYLMELVHDKLEVEYMNWLGRVQGFIASD